MCRAVQYSMMGRFDLMSFSQSAIISPSSRRRTFNFPQLSSLFFLLWIIIKAYRRVVGWRTYVSPRSTIASAIGILATLIGWMEVTMTYIQFQLKEKVGARF